MNLCARLLWRRSRLHFRMAAQLTPAGRRRIQRLVTGAETGRQAGRPEQLGLLQQAANEATDLAIRAEIDQQGRPA